MNFKKAFLLVFVLLTVFASCKKESQLDEDKDVIESFLKNNGVSYEEHNNIFYTVIQEGTGEECKAGDTIAVKFRLSLMSNEQKALDSSLVKAVDFYMPASVPTYDDGLLPGVQIGMTTMKVGGKSKFYIPSSYGYGSSEIGGETYANLIYYVELCAIKHRNTKH